MVILGGVLVFAMFSCDTSQKSEAERRKREEEAELQERQLEAQKRGMEQRAQYLREYHSQLKVVREELVEQMELNRRNRDRLSELLTLLVQDDAKVIVNDKLRILGSQEGVLKEQIRRIDNEAEKGLVVRAIHKLDGGGVVPDTLKELTIESSRLVASTRALITQVNGFYNTGCRVPSTEAPVKAELVSYRYVDRLLPARNGSSEEAIWPLGKPEGAGKPEGVFNDAKRVPKAEVVRVKR